MISTSHASNPEPAGGRNVTKLCIFSHFDILNRTPVRLKSLKVAQPMKPFSNVTSSSNSWLGCLNASLLSSNTSNESIYVSSYRGFRQSSLPSDCDLQAMPKSACPIHIIGTFFPKPMSLVSCYHERFLIMSSQFSVCSGIICTVFLRDFQWCCRHARTHYLRRIKKGLHHRAPQRHRYTIKVTALLPSLSCRLSLPPTSHFVRSSDLKRQRHTAICCGCNPD